MDVFFDKEELQAGEAWEAKLRRGVSECSIFIPIISRETLTAHRRFFRVEWNLAIEEALKASFLADESFLVPVAIDDTAVDDPALPAKFRSLQWEECSPARCQRHSSCPASSRSIVSIRSRSRARHERGTGRRRVGHAERGQPLAWACRVLRLLITTEEVRAILPLLVFDQFEEIFTLGRADPVRSAATETLIEQLSDVAEGRPSVAVKARLDAHPPDAAAFTFSRHHYKILLTIREDFLAELEGLRGRLSAVALNRYRLRRMNGHAALLVVNQAPQLIDSAVAEQVVRFVGAGRPGVALSGLEVEPALLSVVCRELNEERRRLGDSKISPRLLEGSQEDVLAGFYESSVADLPPGARSFIEERLLTVSGYRDSVALENALGMPDVTRAVIDRLVQRRLVRIEDRAGVQRIELTHDLLTGVVRASRDRRRSDEAAQRERLAREEAQERERSAVAQLRKTRRIGLAFLVLAIVAVVASVLSFLAQREAGRQERHARAAVARFAVQDAERHVSNGRRDVALAHLAYALRSDPESEVARGWITDLVRRPWWLPRAAVRHDMRILAASISASGVRLVAASQLTVRVLDGESGKTLGEPVRFSQTLPSVKFVDEGRRIVLATREDARLLDAVTGRQVAHFTTEGTIAAISDGRRVLTYTKAFALVGGQLALFDLESAKPLAQIAEELIVWDLSRDGRRVLTWSNEERVARVWDAVNGTRLGEAINPGDIIGDTATFSPDGRRVITAFRPDKARIWDAETGKPVGEELNHGEFVGFVSFSPDSRLVLTASRIEGSVRVWDVETGKEVCDENLPPTRVESVRWSGDGRRLLIRSGADARVWDTQRCLLIGEPLRHDEAVTAAEISADGRRMLTASSKTAQIWDEYNRTPPSGEPGAYGVPVGFARDGRRVVMISKGSEDLPTSQLWDIESEARVGQPLTAAPVQFSADGKRLLVQSPTGLQVQDAETGGTVGNTVAPDLDPAYVRTSRDGRRLLEGSPDKSILWDLENAQPVGQPLGGERTERVFVAPTDRVVRVFNDGRIQIWDARSAKPVGEAIPQKARARSVAFTIDGRRALVLSADAPARLLDMVNGRQIGAELPSQGAATAAAFSPDDRLAMVAAADGSVQLLNAEDGKPVGPGIHQPSTVEDAVMNRNGQRLVKVDEQFMTRLWDTSNGALVSEPLSEFVHEKCKAAFSGDGRRLLVPISSRTDRVFDATSGRAMGDPIRRGSACSVFDAAGTHVIRASTDGMVEVLEILVAAGSPAAIDRLADLAEAVGGYRVTALGSLEVLADRQQRLDQLRNATSQPADARPRNSPVRRLTTGVLDRPDAR